MKHSGIGMQHRQTHGSSVHMQALCWRSYGGRCHFWHPACAVFLLLIERAASTHLLEALRGLFSHLLDFK